jgi:hypothetical protein
LTNVIEQLLRHPGLLRIVALATVLLIAACNNGQGGSGY